MVAEILTEVSLLLLEMQQKLIIFELWADDNIFIPFTVWSWW
jgi:hypothetical protein